MVYKEYKPQVRTEIDFTALAAMPALVEESLSYPEAERLISIAAWPCRIIENGGAPTGFVMPAIPEQFVIALRTAKGTSPSTAEFQHLLNHPSVLVARGITIDDVQHCTLLREVASGLAFIHKHGVCVGDISPKNLLFALTPQEAIYFIDCDAIRINGVSALPQVETPGWETPAGEELATIYSDTYKLGLLALRLLAGDQNTKDPQHLPSTTPGLLRQIIIDTLTNDPHTRPLPEAWTYVLGQAIEETQHQKLATPPTANPLTPPAIPRVHSRPPINVATTPPPQPTNLSTALTRLTAHSRPPVGPSAPPPRRTLSSAQRALLWAAGVLGTAAIVIAVLIVINARAKQDQQTQQPQSPPTVSQSVTTPNAMPPPATTTTTQGGPRQVTYSVTGTKAPGDIITVTFTDASGHQRTQRNVYIPWSLTVTPTSQSDVGSVQASSLFLVSRLNCEITTSDGQVLSANSSNSPQISCAAQPHPP